MTDKMKMRKQFDFLTTLILNMKIQKVIHVHIQSQKKKEWNLVVLTIVSSIDYEERILSYMCRNGPSLEYRLYFFLVLTTS